jgi:hypothetical protein
VRDRQYVSSLAVTVAVLALVLGGLVCVPLWTGWVGGVGLLALVGGSLVWFYRGARPDLMPRSGCDKGARLIE